MLVVHDLLFRTAAFISPRIVVTPYPMCRYEALIQAHAPMYLLGQRTTGLVCPCRLVSPTALHLSRNSFSRAPRCVYTTLCYHYRLSRIHVFSSNHRPSKRHLHYAWYRSYVTANEITCGRALGIGSVSIMDRVESSIPDGIRPDCIISVV